MSKTDWANIGIKELAGIISTELQKNNIEAILVGGACVSIYSDNEYLSNDLDYVSYNTIKEIKPCLEAIGFKQTASNRFENEKCEFYIEFVNPPVSIGQEAPIRKFNKINTRQGKITLFTPTDCVKDRLAAYYHWGDPQSLEQAIMVVKQQSINMKEVESWSVTEGHHNEFKKFMDMLNE